MSINNKIKKARIKMFRKAFGLEFFGSMSYMFDLDIHPMDMDAEGYVIFDNKDPNKLTYGTIHVNKNFVIKDDYTYDNLIFIQIHEMLHILKKHGIRRGNRDNILWNIAGDHVIECELKDIKHISPYKNQYNIIDKLKKEIPNCSTEQAYDWLNKKQKNNQMSITLSPGSGDDGIGTAQVNINGQKLTFVIKQEVKPGTSEFDDQKNILEAISNKARNLLDMIKERGSTSSNLVEYLTKLLAIEIPWEEILEKAIRTNIVLVPDDRSWRKLNIFFMPHSLTLPGYAMCEDTDGYGTLILTVDTSGSISSKQLNLFASVISQSMQYFYKILVLVHDVIVHQRLIFNSDQQHEFIEFIKETGFKGRGGTSHIPVFNEIEEFHEKHDDRDELSMVISLTDNYSDINNNLLSSLKWIKEKIPLTLLITPDGTLDEYDLSNVTSIKMSE